MTVEPTHPPARPLSPLTAASAFLAACEMGETAAAVALCAAGAEAVYAPCCEGGTGTVSTAAMEWVRYPAAVEGFSQEIVEICKDPTARIAVVPTLNRGRQRSTIYGIRKAGHRMAGPHLFMISVDQSAQITRVELSYNELTLDGQLGFPERVVVETRA